MKIRVEPRHILAGERDSFTGCPISLALQDAQPQVEKWSVDEFNILHTSGWYRDPTGAILSHTARKFRTPSVVAGFVKAWDMGLKCRPIEFDLDIDDWGEETSQ